MNQLKHVRLAIFVGLIETITPSLLAKSDVAYEINNKPVSMETLKERNKEGFYKIESEMRQLVKSMGEQEYLDYFWEDLAKKTQKTVPLAKEKYIKEKGGYSEKEFKETLEQFKDHPSLKELNQKDKEMQVRRFLESKAEQEVVQKILDDAEKNKNLVIKIPQPSEPIYNVVVNEQDHVRYGAKSSEVKPVGCSGVECPITIVEYSEFQCPFCAKVLPTTKKILTDYRGKVRWIVRDFPLSFHDRARPAAIAAKCAAEQGAEKYWEMYEQLFQNQRKLADDDLNSYAKNIGLDHKKYQACVTSPKEANSKIDANLAFGSQEGVTGTPAFLINGRRLSGALPYPEFKKIIDEELVKHAAKNPKPGTAKK